MIVFQCSICDRHSFPLQAVTLLIGLIAAAWGMAGMWNWDREEPLIEVKVYILEGQSTLSLRTHGIGEDGPESVVIILKQVFYNDEMSTIPKKAIARCKSEAQLESFMREAFQVPFMKSVKLTFKSKYIVQKQIFLEDHVKEQLSRAIAVYMDDIIDA